MSEYQEKEGHLVKVFCPTGPGGGVDSSCGSGGSSSSIHSMPGFQDVDMSKFSGPDQKAIRTGLTLAKKRIS